MFRNEYGSTQTARASTYTWKMGSTILETDIVFWDKAVTFISDSTPCTNEIYIENTAIHEFGHALELDHSTVTTATMYGSGPACSTTRLILDPDDIKGVETLTRARIPPNVMMETSAPPTFAKTRRASARKLPAAAPPTFSATTAMFAPPISA